MSQAMGVYSETRIYPETSLKTLPTAIKGYKIPFNSNTFSSSQNTTAPATITGRRDAVQPILGNVDTTGDLTIPLDLTATGYLLAAAFGKPTSVSAGDSTGLYTHTFKAGKTQPSFTVEKAFSNGLYSIIKGTKVNQLETSFGGDGELTLRAGLLGCDETIGKVPVTTTGITEVGFNRLNNFQSSILIDGVESAVVTDLSLTIAFGLDDSGYAIGSKGYRTRINEGLISPTGKLTAFFDDESFVDRAINATSTAIQIKLANADGKQSLVIDLPEVQFARKTPSIDGTKGITQELDFSAFYKAAKQGTCIQFTLTNDTPSYDF